MKADEYIFDNTLTKRPGVYKKVDNILYPILYFQKANGATNEDFEKIVKHLIRKK